MGVVFVEMFQTTQHLGDQKKTTKFDYVEQKCQCPAKKKHLKNEKKNPRNNSAPQKTSQTRWKNAWWHGSLLPSKQDSHSTMLQRWRHLCLMENNAGLEKKNHQLETRTSEVVYPCPQTNAAIVKNEDAPFESWSRFFFFKKQKNRLTANMIGIM